MAWKRRQEKDVREALGGDALENECGIECALLLTPGFTSDKHQMEVGQKRKRFKTGLISNKKKKLSRPTRLPFPLVNNKRENVIWGHDVTQMLQTLIIMLQGINHQSLPSEFNFVASFV